MSQPLIRFKKHLLLWLSVSFYLLTPSLFAQAKDDKKMLISYVVYPQIEHYINLINDIYRELGYTITMIPTPADRGLILLNDGEVDADVVRIKSSINNYPNVILVEPPLMNIKLVLLCDKKVKCNQSVLQNKKEVILTTENMMPYLAEFNVIARIEKVHAITKLVEMLKVHKINYATIVIDDVMNFTQNLNHVVLQEMPVHHVTHKKHADLLPLIQQKIREKLPALDLAHHKKTQ